MPSIALACLIGALCAFYGNHLPDPFWYGFWPIFIWLAWWQRPYRFLLITIGSYLLFCISFQHSLADRLVDSFHDQSVTIQGKISSLVTERQGRLSFLVQPTVQFDSLSQLPALIRLNWYQDTVMPTPGSIWQLEVKLRPPRTRLNPGGFDYQKWLLVSGIGATGYVRGGDNNQLLHDPASWDITNIRHRLLQQLRQACEGCSSEDLILGLAIGFRGEISKTHRELLELTGTAHLLAISGLHIGMVAMLFYWTGALLWRSLLWRTGLTRITVASGTALAGAIVFSGMAGFSLPTVRALIFVIVVFLAWLLRERVNLLQCISIAVVIILVIDPLAIGSASFWLTLSALLTISVTLFQVRQVRNRLQQAVILQLAFSLLLALPSLMILGYFSLISLPANLLAVPLVSLLILPLIFISGLMLLAEIPFVPTVLLSIADFGLESLMLYLNWLAGLAPPTTGNGGLSWWLIISTSVVVIAWWLPFPNAMRKLGLVILLMLVQRQSGNLNQGEFSLTVLDSGLGNAIVVGTRSHILLYDFGPGRRDGYSTYESVIKPFLRGQPRQSLDMMIISHVDHDHSGGFYALDPADIEATLVSGTPGRVQQRFQLHDAPRSCHDYHDWQWDGVRFEFLAALPGDDNSSNNSSCVLKITGHHSAILPGDIERQREHYLAGLYGDHLRANILVTPHHGSNTSSSSRFLSQVFPATVIHTQAEGNRWGFPHADVVNRYESIGAYQLSSASDGAVQFKSTSSGLQIELSRQSGQRIWR